MPHTPRTILQSFSDLEADCFICSFNNAQMWKTTSLRVLSVMKLIFLALYGENWSLSVGDNCTCEYQPEVDWVGPFCSEWVLGDPPFCYLSGGADGKFCPEAVKSGSGHFYWTKHESICAKDIEYVEKNCNCHYSEDFDWAGPYCSRWINGDPPFCFFIW